jgi:hypothetical protein
MCAREVCAKNIAKRVKSGAKLATSVIINYAHTTFIALLETRSPSVWVAQGYAAGSAALETSAAQGSMLGTNSSHATSNVPPIFCVYTIYISLAYKI